MSRIEELFGSMVFNDVVMQERLPEDTYAALKRTMEVGKKLDPAVADVVARAMNTMLSDKSTLMICFLFIHLSFQYFGRISLFSTTSATSCSVVLNPVFLRIFLM